MIEEHASRVAPSSNVGALVRGPWTPIAGRGRILLVDDNHLVREATGALLKEEGYAVSFAENGHDALRRLYAEPLPDIILLDLKMPVMDGWEFRAIQKDDPRLGLIPVIAFSADGSPQAAAISAQAYLRKPLASKELLLTVERLLFETERQKATRADDTERLAALGRLAANIGHEINNPLTFVMANLTLSLEAIAPAVSSEVPSPSSAQVELAALKDSLGTVREMLEECQMGSDRIRETVGNLQRLSRSEDAHSEVLDVQKLIEQSISMAWNEIRHRARLVKEVGKTPLISGNGVALGQVFLNLLVNAAQAIPEGHAETNEIRISTCIQLADVGDELVVEIEDSGSGIAPELVSHLFEPFYTTKPAGQGTGLGLSISRQTVVDHGGRLTVDSQVGKGTIFRVILPILSSQVPVLASVAAPETRAGVRGRVLVIDDEASIGRGIENTLKNDHDVVVVARASEALTRLETDQAFDLILCDVVMPDVSGPQFYEIVAERWPRLVKRLVFMTGGAFTSGTVEFLQRRPTRILSKPFAFQELRHLIRDSVESRP